VYSRLITRTLALLIAALVACRLALRAGIDPGFKLSRKTLVKLGGAGITVLATGRWFRPSSASAAACVLSPEQTEGPYYIAREKVRSNITEGHPGAPLRLRLAVQDAATCKPIKGAAVDIWHCDAGGAYSGFEAASGGAPGAGGGPTDKHTFLRGIQFTNSKGIAQFHSIYPGWYRGRTVHIHIKVHLDRAVVGHVAHTGQLYFSDALTAKVYRSSPYKARAAQRDTFNSTDGIYSNGGRQSTLSVRQDGHGGFVGTITLGVHRS
jgi:protocatechuate 3,4-dioxygenase beta subunit